MPADRQRILGIGFNALSVSEAADIIIAEIIERRGGSDTKSGAKSETKSASKTPFIVVTPNPEIVMLARKDTQLKYFINGADIVAADGIGIVWASGILAGCSKNNGGLAKASEKASVKASEKASEKAPIKERASGYDIVMEVFGRAAETDGGITAYFLGGGYEAVQKAAVKMEGAHRGLIVAGAVSGYFKPREVPSIINGINAQAPDMLLVGLGAPKQERFVMQNAARINAGVIIVVGGSFDVMSGDLRRAPLFFRKHGIEWLYRLIKQPKRIFRMARLPLFVMKVLVERINV